MMVLINNNSSQLDTFPVTCEGKCTSYTYYIDYCISLSEKWEYTYVRFFA